MTIEYLSLFVSWVESFLILQLHRLLHSIVSYASDKVDKRFFKSWVLHIPHCLRDLLWMMRAWSSVSSIFPSLLMNLASSSSWSLLKCNHFLLEHIPWMNEFHDFGRPFKVAITTSAPLQVVLDLRDSYNCMISAFWIFTFFN